MPRGFVNALDWAFGDAVNDDANALNQAASHAADNGKWLWVPRTGNSYNIGSQVTIPAGVGVKCYGSITALSGISKTSPAVVVGATGVAHRFVEIEIRLDNASVGSGADWSSMAYVGVRLYNPQNCPIRIFAARGFTVGLEIIGDGAGGAFNNQVYFGDIADCRYALQLDGRNAQPVKNNLLVGGRWTISGAASSAQTEVERGLARFISSDASAAALVRNNSWIKPSPTDVPRGSTASSRRLFYLHTQGPMNEIRDCAELTELDVAKGDADLVADGAQALANIVHLGDHEGGRALTIATINGAPSHQNAVNTWRNEVSNFDLLGGTTA